MEIYWYLIPQDGPYPWHPKGRRTIDYSYLAQIARAVDHLGYTGALLATGGGEHDAWVLGSSLIPITQRMKFIIAVHPGIVAPLSTTPSRWPSRMRVCSSRQRISIRRMPWSMRCVLSSPRTILRCCVSF
ncbi:LLM class flavin-dependent oxidoreductase [Bradyrhizobium sp. 61]|nr:LLM class flavin-dependent oxidoreductase [Bradyrhizobium sp. 61]